MAANGFSWMAPKTDYPLKDLIIYGASHLVAPLARASHHTVCFFLGEPRCRVFPAFMLLPFLVKDGL